MKELSKRELQEVNGGIFFVVPMWMVYGTIATELAIIASFC